MELTQFTGEWAVVTGASSGIGRAYAQALASRKIHLLLVARRAPLLDSTAAELRAAHGVRAESVPLDLTEPGATTRLLQLLSARQIVPRMLVNNAGAGRWGRFEDAGIESCRSMLLLNAQATMELCHALLPSLAQRPPGAIIMVSSPAALQPVPFMAAYAASKAFVHHLGLALHEEWRERGVYVQTLVPGPTQTDFDRLAGAYDSSLGTARRPPEDVVAASLRGFSREQALVTSASGVFGQKLFAALAPTKFLLSKVGGMFRPPPA